MVKTNDNGDILIYRKIDKKTLKEALLLLLIALLIGLILFLAYRSLFFLPFAVIPALGFIIGFIIYKKPDEEKLFFSLTKEGFTFHSKNNAFFSLNSIINFVSINDNGNYACINYYDENKNKKSKIFLVYGCSNTEFANLTNTYLRENSNNSNTITNEPNVGIKNMEFVDQTKRYLDDISKNGNTLRFTLVGKTKMLINKGNAYNLLNFLSYLIFINDRCEIIKLPLTMAVINWEDLIINGVYEISYNKTKEKFFVTKILNAESVNYELINGLKNNIIYRAKILFDKQMILNEINTYNRIMKSTKILGVSSSVIIFITCITKLLLNKYTNISNEELTLTAAMIIALVFPIALIVYPSIILLNLQKLKKENGKDSF